MINNKCDILLINPSYHRRSGSGVIPPIGLAYLSSFLSKNGFTSQVLDCSLYFDKLDNISLEQINSWLQKKLLSIQPRLAIGIGPCTTSAIRSIITIVDACKKSHPNKPLIFGGPLTFIPDQEWVFFEKFSASAVVKGDGEHALKEILIRLRDGDNLSNIPGVQTEINQRVNPYFVENIDDLPYPNLDVFELNLYKPSIRRDLFVYPFVPMIGSRGCPNNCCFCISGNLIKYRRHSFEYIVGAVKHLKNKYHIKSVIFYDDNLFSNSSNVNDELCIFADLFLKSVPDVLWQIEIRPDVFSQISNHTFRFIRSCGCRQMNIGIEKSSPDLLTSLYKQYDAKQLMNACQRAINNCPDMRLAGTFILGGPNETLDTIKQTIEFSTKLPLLFAHYYPMEIYPGTPIYKLIFNKNNKIWFEKIMGDNLSWGEIVYDTKNISASKLIELVSSAYCQFYNRREWRDVTAKQHFKNNYNKIMPTVASWQNDRFRLNTSDQI